MKNPTPGELRRALKFNDFADFTLLLQVCGVRDFDDALKPLSTSVVMQMAFFDWLRQQHVEFNTAQSIMITLTCDLLIYATYFQLNEEVGMPIKPLKPCSFTLLDGRFLRITGLPGFQEGFFDRRALQWVEAMPHQALTVLGCDLNVLMLRLSDKLEEQRSRQEARSARENADAAIIEYIDETLARPERAAEGEGG